LTYIYSCNLLGGTDIYNNLNVYGDISFNGSLASSSLPSTSGFLGFGMGFTQLYLDTTFVGPTEDISKIRVPFNNTYTDLNDSTYYDISNTISALVITEDAGIKVLKNGIYRISYSIILENDTKIINTNSDSDINWKVCITDTHGGSTTDISMGTTYTFTNSTKYYYLNNSSANFTGLLQLQQDHYYNIVISAYVSYS
tara:strand:+ start:24 stop:617 length:594 start_codon:yes stop_codon:yes gene_type:complete